MLVGIDCGHGSNTAGKRTAPFTRDVDTNKDGSIDIKKSTQYKEHNASVMVAEYLYEEFLRQGWDVFKSAWNDNNALDDEDVALSKRQTSIRAAGCDYTVSLHFNAYGDGNSFNNAQGIETLIHSTSVYRGDSKTLADRVQNCLSLGTKQINRGVKTSQLAMCNCYRMCTKASILVELAFMTNEHEAVDLMASEDFCKECAMEICKGFCDYLSKNYVSEAIFPYVAKVTKDGLWVRKTPSLDDKMCVTKLSLGSQYTIVGHDVTGKFGKLKSGIGYVYLKYMKNS